jgi:hypothetical protein
VSRAHDALKRSASKTGTTAPTAKGGFVPATYTYVEGTALASFLLDVRALFVSLPPHDGCESARPNSVRFVALSRFERLSRAQRSELVSELLEFNGELHLNRCPDAIFLSASAPGHYVTDVVCEVACQVLRGDAAIHAEDELRLALTGSRVV